MDGDNDEFKPNAEYMEALIGMGIGEQAAHEALFCTGNESVEAAVSYVFNNFQPGQPQQDDDSDPDRDPDDVYRQYKMSFVVNTSLKMGVGKIASQVGHACLGLYRDMIKKGEQGDALRKWEYHGEKKIVLKGNNAEHLEELYHKAVQANIPAHLISDAGHTQIPSGSITVLSLFGVEAEVNAFTEGLGLL